MSSAESKLKRQTSPVQEDVEIGELGMQNGMKATMSQKPALDSEHLVVNHKAFRFETIMVPFHFNQFLTVFVLHLFPYYHMIFDRNKPELTSMFIIPQWKQAGWKSVGICVMFTHRWIVLFWTTIGIYIYLASTPCAQQVYAEDPVKHTAITPLAQALSGTLWVPVLCFILHRVAVANKYACLSKAEYDKYIHETDFEKNMEKMMSLNLFTAWYQFIPDKVLQFEMYAAAARMGFETSRMHFHVANPLMNLNAYQNFRHWQAFLLGRDNVEGLTHQVHADLANVFERVNLNEYTAHAVDKITIGSKTTGGAQKVVTASSAHESDFDVAVEQERAEDFKKTAEALGGAVATIEGQDSKSKFKLLAKKVVKVDQSLSKKSVSKFFYYRVPFTTALKGLYTWSHKVPSASAWVGKIVNYSTILICLIPWTEVTLAPLDNHLSKFDKILAYMYLFINSSILYTFWAAVMGFLTVAIADAERRVTIGLMLKDMIRGTDLDGDGDVATMGWSPAQRTSIPDYISISEDKLGRYIAQFHSGRNADVARMPKIYTSQGGKNNFIMWSYMRSLTRVFAARFKFRLDAYATLTFLLVTILLCTVLFQFLNQYSAAIVGEVLPPISRVSYYSPFTVQVFFTSVVSLIQFVYVIYVGMSVNGAYLSHGKTLLERLLKNEAQKSFLVDHKGDLGSQQAGAADQRIEQLEGMSVALFTTMRNIKEVDKLHPMQIFSLPASPQLFTLLATYVGAWVSITSTLLSYTKDFSQFTRLFLPGNFDAVAFEECKRYALTRLGTDAQCHLMTRAVTATC